MVLITRCASVFHGGNYRVARSSNPIIAANVGDLDHTSTERSRRLIVLPVVADSSDLGPVGVCLSAGTSCTFLEVDSSFTIVTIEGGQLNRRRG